jgi:class 3 adenylate cyclase/tetratricopeptide (TPR) repeat protein
MDCPNCSRANRDGANYCRYCGTHFALACPRCRAVLLPDSLYCDNCGLALERAAAGLPAAGPAARAARASLTAGSAPLGQSPAEPARPADQPQLQQYIPAELMQKLEAARSRGEMVGERRIVTMLFCDVKGSTAAAEQLDPEDYSEIMNGGFTHMIRPVYRYEGTLARLMGDALLAFFGAPIAHEDDPQRAVLAGLDIVAAMQGYREQVREKWALDFDVRVGINTGLVVVGAVGSDLRVEYSALGDAINLAARMEQTATPGTVQIAQDTYKAVRHLFEVESLGSIEVKGKSEPVPAYRVLRRKAAAGQARGIEGLHADLVGREAEMTALREMVNDLQQGVGRIVGILGEAGLGKTRLVAETARVFRTACGANIAWHAVGSLSYETSQAYGLIQRLIRRVQGIDDNDPAAVVREKLSALASGLPGDQVERTLQAFEALFGFKGEGSIPAEGDAFRRELRLATVAWWRARFASVPTILVFDDMHWSDAASVALLRELLPMIDEMPLVLMCVLRTERQAPAWQLRNTAEEEYHHRYLELSLRPLSPAESNELLNGLLAVAELPDRLRANVLEKAGGNPFFIEEVVRALIDNGAVIAEDRPVPGGTRRYWRATSAGAEVEIPGTLQALLAARMDRLEDATRGTLQLASVIGRSFYHRLLQAVDEASPELDQHLGALLRTDMIREAARVPELEYAFRNPLTQEAVYKTILLKRRRIFHRRVGEAMEMLYSERLDDLLGLLAHHFRLGGQNDKAIDYSRRAARRAVGLFAYDDAVRNLSAALDLIPAGSNTDQNLTLREELGDVYRLLRDGTAAMDQYQQALALWRSDKRADKLVAVRLHRKVLQVVTDLKWTVSLEDLQQANANRLASRAMLAEAMPFLIAEPPQLETVRALVALSTDAWRLQDPPDWEAAQGFAQSAVDLATQLDSPVDKSQALGALATVLDGRSQLREHLAVAQQRLELCRLPDFDRHENIEAIRGAAAALMYVGEYEQALPGLQEAEQLAASAQVIDQQTNALGLQAQCYYRLDRWDEVLEIEAKWRDLERRYPRERVGETCFFAALSAGVHALRGDRQRADAYAQESVEYMVSMSGRPENWQRNQFY